ncbi:MAG: Rne/Rng family ribonuclease [Actinomycetales bacterium]|nr:Rne/Rng family ribonuclease [Actinomycetales bacterium]
MVDENSDSAATDVTAATAKRSRRRAASRPAGPPATESAPEATPAAETADEAPKAPRKSTRKSTKKTAAPAESVPGAPAEAAKAEKAEKKAPAKRTRKKAAASAEAAEPSEGGSTAEAAGDAARMTTAPGVAPLFKAPEITDAEPEEKPKAKRTRTSTKKAAAEPAQPAEEPAAEESEADGQDDSAEAGEDTESGRRRRRRRGGRGRKRRSGEDAADEGESSDESDSGEGAEESEDGDSAGTKRRRRRRRRGGDGDADGWPDDPPNTVVRVREPRSARDDVTSLKGSTRLEAKKQRRREGREAGRRRAPILTEAEFLARRESVNRVMAVRQKGDRTQIAVLEDGVLVEHYVTRGSASSMVGNVYLGRVQNVLPSMEAAFVDIGRGRNAVLYAGEVNWDAAGLEGQPKRIEFALKSGDPVLVQVTKDPVGQKGARLTSQVSLPGRFLVYVPDGSMTGISRKLPDTERSRLKSILKRVMPEDAGVIVRTAAEGAPELALEQDVARLTAQWEDINAAATSATPPSLLYSEPDLAIKVVRDIFNEDVNALVISGDTAWASISAYIGAVAPDLAERLQHWVEPRDLFAEYRVDEQLMKALDRKVYLPSGGSLVIDRTEAMTVVDVNTGKFTGQGGNLEQTVTRNNLEAAEEIVRQLRLRDIGGIIVVDFIDMVLESNRDLVLRRLVECLGRDRTKHQVAEVTSLGLVQMTRKRIGSGLLESFSETCDHCNGRGIRVSLNGSDDHHHDSPRGRKPVGFVDPAEAAARALASHDEPSDEETGVDMEVDAVEDAVEEALDEADREPGGVEPDVTEVTEVDEASETVSDPV